MSQASIDIPSEQSLNETQISKDLKPKVKWTAEHERILVDWADKALCYRWLHGKAHERYSKLNTWFTIPVIIMSTLTGTANRVTVTNGDGVSGNPTIDISTSYVGQNTITTLGTVTTGTWNAGVVGVVYGGTGLNTLTSRGIVFGNGTSPAGVTAASTIDGSFLREDSAGNPYWSNVIDGGTY